MVGRRGRKTVIDPLAKFDPIDETDMSEKDFDKLWDEMTSKTGIRVGKNYHKTMKFEYLNNKIIHKKRKV